MSVISKLRVWFGADTTEVEKGFKKVKDEGNSLTKGFDKLKGTIAAAFSVAAITTFIKEAYRLAEIQWKAEKRLEAGIKATGEAVGYTAKQLKNYAAELQEVTLFGDEVTIGAMARLVPYTNVTGEIFKKTIALAQDLATIMETDLNSAVVKLGKALNVPGVGLDELREAGIAFTTQQIADIQRLVSEGDIYAAQMIILEEAYRHVGGAAQELAGNTDMAFASVTQLSNAWGDLLEEAGNSSALNNILLKLVSVAQGAIAFISLAYSDSTALMAKITEWMLSEEEVAQVKMIQELRKELELLTEAELKARLEDAQMWKDKDQYYPKHAIQMLQKELAIRKDAVAMEARAAKAASEYEAQRLAAIEAEKTRISEIMNADESSLAAITEKITKINELIDVTSIYETEALTSYQNEVSRLQAIKAEYESLGETMARVNKFRSVGGEAVAAVSVTGQVGDVNLEELKEMANKLIEESKTSIVPVKIPLVLEVDDEYVINWGSQLNAVFSNIGQSLGNAITGNFNAGDLLTPIADIAQQLGTLLISVGTAILAFETSLSTLNPFVAIAAGTALVAAAAAFRNFAKDSGSGMATSTAAGGSSYSTQLSDYKENKVKIEGTFKAEGEELVAVINEVNNNDRYRK